MARQRITRKHIDAQLVNVNRLLGHDVSDAANRVPGALSLEGAYGGVTVHQNLTDGSGGVTQVMYGYHSMRDVSTFLSGMRQALLLKQQ